MNILFITRKHPPAVGGMEKLSYHLTTEMAKIAKTYKIAWGGSQKWLLFFMIYAFFKASRICGTKKIDVIHIGDPVLSILGVVLKKLFNKPIAVTCHGLDLTYRSIIYQKYLDLFFTKLDKYICISRYTQELACRRIAREKTKVIPVGVSTDFQYVSRKYKHPKTLITVGRLVKRKGIYWFLTTVFPKLPTNYNYTIIGDGPEQMKIKSFIENNSLHQRVSLITGASDAEVHALYAGADVFVMPNIHVEHDVEGFGLVALEAAATGLPVVAAAVDGIPTAVVHNKNGCLVPERDADAFCTAIRRARPKKMFSEYSREHYAWEKIAQHYLEAFRT